MGPDAGLSYRRAGRFQSKCNMMLARHVMGRASEAASTAIDALPVRTDGDAGARAVRAMLYVAPPRRTLLRRIARGGAQARRLPVPGVRSAGTGQVVDRGAPPGTRGLGARPDDRALPPAPRHCGAERNCARGDAALAAGAVAGAPPGRARAGLAGFSRDADACSRSRFALWQAWIGHTLLSVAAG